MATNHKIRVLFVCMGNICRSPTGEGVFRHLVEARGLAGKIDVDSAGTGAWHVGQPPDERATAEARKQGIDLSNQRARAVADSDFDDFDYIIAMDDDNMLGLQSRCPAKFKNKLHKCTDFAPGIGVDEVPDPYYGGPGGFNQVFKIVEAGAKGLLGHIQKNDLK